jgi:glucokinase
VNITAEKVGQAAKKGDALALEVITEAARYLGVGLANLVNIFNPDIIVIGGGLSKLGDLLLEPTRDVVRERAFRLPSQVVRVVSSELEGDAGILGAAIFAHEMEKTTHEQS